ncbi:MAG: hypothetical protein KAJ44_04160 [Thermoplasmatales archaeon]|nr:hypothetical protein [Thermoplasmatales archaeon]
MEVGLITLGGFLIIASFEIHFRYIPLAKEYYRVSLNEASEKLDSLLNKKKKSLRDKNDLQLSGFLNELGVILGKFSQKKFEANFHLNLFYGFFAMGVFIILLGLISDAITESYVVDPVPVMFFIVIFGGVISVFIFQGLIVLRKVTRIV